MPFTEAGTNKAKIEAQEHRQQYARILRYDKTNDIFARCYRDYWFHWHIVHEYPAGAFTSVQIRHYRNICLIELVELVGDGKQQNVLVAASPSSSATFRLVPASFAAESAKPPTCPTTCNPPNPMTYRIILFDFDGTLADSAQCSILATQAAFAALLADFRRLLQRLYR